MNGLEKGTQYQWVMVKRDSYHHDGVDPKHERGAVLPLPEHIGWLGNYRVWPFNTQLNAFPSANVVEQGRWYTFVLHVRWSVCDCTVTASEKCLSPKTACQPPLNGKPEEQPGILEFWVDGQLVYPITTGTNPDLATRPTLYKWPAESASTPLARTWAPTASIAREKTTSGTRQAPRCPST